MAEPVRTADKAEPIPVGIKPARINWNEKVAAFFDRLAPEWDARMVIDEGKLNLILDAAGVKKDVVVLDVACGTGVLFPYYLRRNVARVIGVDISAEMVRIAAQKADDPRCGVICGDIEMVPVRCPCFPRDAFGGGIGIRLRSLVYGGHGHCRPGNIYCVRKTEPINEGNGL